VRTHRSRLDADWNTALAARTAADDADDAGDQGGDDDTAGDDDDQGGDDAGDDAGDDDADDAGDNDNDDDNGGDAGDNEKVEVTASELRTLREKANAGHRAEQRLVASEIAATVGKMTFSSENREGVVLAKMSDKVNTFMLGLTPAQRKDFTEILTKGVVATKMSFGEMGSDDNGPAGDFMTRVDSAIEKKMSENSSLDYATAMSMVFRENPEMAKEYNKNYVV